MSKVKVYPFFKSPYLVSRDMANKLLKNYPKETIFDFDKINFVSAAFADELIKNVPVNRIINTPKNIRNIFRAVSSR